MVRRAPQSQKAPLLTVLAESEDVEAVTVRLETLCIGESFDGGCHIAFEGRGGGHIDDSAAVGAQEVVVVLGELLGQLVASELVIGRDPPHHPGDLKVEEVTVGGTARKIGQSIGDIPDADGMTGVDQQADDGSAAGCVALIGPAKPVLDDIVQVILGSSRCHHALLSSHQRVRIRKGHSG